MRAKSPPLFLSATRMHQLDAYDQIDFLGFLAARSRQQCAIERLNKHCGGEREPDGMLMLFNISGVDTRTARQFV